MNFRKGKFNGKEYSRLHNTQTDPVYRSKLIDDDCQMQRWRKEDGEN